MLKKSIGKCEYFQVPDKTVLCELLHPKNDEIEMGCSIAHALLEVGKESIPHKLKESVEIYYVLEGEGLMHIDEESEVLKTGDVVYIPPGSVQWIKNIGNNDLKFLCVVTPPWKKEDELLCD